jgi:hypothetical protein
MSNSGKVLVANKMFEFCHKGSREMGGLLALK